MKFIAESGLAANDIWWTRISYRWIGYNSI